MTDYDVAVIGLGAWGASATWRAAARGLSVIAFDTHRPPHNLGSHSGTTRLARWSTSQDVAYAPFTREAFALWAELERDSGTALVETTGALLFAPQHDDALRTPIATLNRLGMPYDVLQPSEVARRFAGVRAQPNELVLYEPQGRRIRSANALTVLHQQSRRLGAQLHFNTPVTRWVPQGDGIALNAGGTTSWARHLILTAGPWSPDVLGVDLPLVVERQVLTMFRSDSSAQLPCLYFARLLPTEGEFGYGAHETDGLFKLAYHHAGVATTPHAVDRTVGPSELERMSRAVRERLPALDPRPVSATVCLYTNTPDDHFVVDRHPAQPNVAVGTGCNGRGFRYAPAIGDALVRLALNRIDPEPIFSANRFQAS